MVAMARYFFRSRVQLPTVGAALPGGPRSPFSPHEPVSPRLPRLPLPLRSCQPSPGQIPGSSRRAIKAAPSHVTTSSCSYFLYTSYVPHTCGVRPSQPSRRARAADPIHTARTLSSLLPRLIEGAVVTNNFTFVNDALRMQNLRDWQFAWDCLEALLYRRKLPFECALHLLVGSFEFLTRGLPFLRHHQAHSLDAFAVRDTVLAPVASRLPFL